MSKENEAGPGPSGGFRDALDALVPLIGTDPQEPNTAQGFPFHVGAIAPLDEVCAGRIRSGACPINKAIAEELSLLGEDGKETILYYLRKRGLTRERLPFEPEELERDLRQILADGSKILQAGMVANIRAVSRSQASEARCSRCAIAWLGDLVSEEAEVVMSCVEKAFDVMGRTGNEVFFQILQSRYGITKSDIVDSPGAFTSTLKVMLDSSASVLMSYALDELIQRLGVKASTLEEAIAILKRRIRHVGNTAGGIEGDSFAAPFTMREQSQPTKARDRFAYQYGTGGSGETARVG
jgi:hypothetical protein